MSTDNFTFNSLILKEGKSFTALCLDLDVASQGNTIQEAKEALVEATALYVESAIESNLPIIRPVSPEEDPRHLAPKDVVETFSLKVNIAVSAHA